MVLRYCGYWVRIDKEKWKALSFKEKLKCVGSYFSGQTEYFIDCLREIPQNLKDYWVGYVDVHTQDIFCGGYGTDEPSHNELYEISIICGKHGNGQWFSHIDKSIVEQLVRDWEFSNKKRFQLHLDLGCGMSQNYTFSKYQKDMLIEELKPLLDMKWYEGSREED